MATKQQDYCLPRSQWQRVRIVIDATRLPGSSHCHANRIQSGTSLCVTLRSHEQTCDACLADYAAQLRGLADSLSP